MAKEYVLIIDAPYFCAGICLENDVVTKCAPIVNYMKGWNVARIRNYCNKKKWQLRETIPFDRADKLDESFKKWRDEYPFENAWDS